VWPEEPTLVTILLQAIVYQPFFNIFTRGTTGWRSRNHWVPRNPGWKPVHCTNVFYFKIFTELHGVWLWVSWNII